MNKETLEKKIRDLKKINGELARLCNILVDLSEDCTVFIAGLSCRFGLMVGEAFPNNRCQEGETENPTDQDDSSGIDLSLENYTSGGNDCLANNSVDGLVYGQKVFRVLPWIILVVSNVLWLILYVFNGQ